MHTDEENNKGDLKSKILNYAIAKGFFPLETANISDEKIHGDFRAVAELADAFALRMSPIDVAMLCVIEADGLNNDEIVGRSARMDRLVKERKFGDLRIGLMRIPTTVFVFLCFSQTSGAKSFRESHRDSCKVNRMFPVRFILPWIVDIEGRRVESHSGIPLLTVFKTKELEMILFR